MQLGKEQEDFTYHFALLIMHAYELGYKIRLGHTLRCQDCPVGKKNSLHKSKLAGDILLFKDGVFLTKTEDHRILGEWWEKQHPLATWGGHFNDGNHYSFTRWGRK